MPIWIHTVEAAAAAGWLAQSVRPDSTRWRTQEGEVVAEGSMTPEGRPVGMPDCSWSRPSNSQTRPKAMRRNRRPAGSGVGRATGGVTGSPRATARRYCMARSWFHPMKRTASRTITRAPWMAS